jgi:hypothetical protein
MLSTARRTALSASMRSCGFYRQYTRSGVYHEPRFHVLLSSEASMRNDAGYSYHGIKMKALPIELVPEVASYAREVAGLYGLPGDRWGIGVDLIAYRDGEDSIGWHADDTQGKTTHARSTLGRSLSLSLSLFCLHRRDCAPHTTSSS